MRRLLVSLRALIKVFYSASLIAQSPTCCTPPQNLLLGNKDKLTNVALIKRNNIPVILYSPTLAAVIAPPVVFALFSIAQYSENDL